MERSSEEIVIAQAVPPAVTVGEFAAWLLASFDPALPLHSKDGAGDFPPVTAEGLRGIVVSRALMAFHDEGPSYTALTTDKAWRDKRELFGPDFPAAVIW